MRMAFRGTATATALALVWAAAVGCSSRGHGAHSAADAAWRPHGAGRPAPAAPAAPAASAKITQAAFNEDCRRRAHRPFRERAPALHRLRAAAGPAGRGPARRLGGRRFRRPGGRRGSVESIRFEELDEMGKRVTRLSIAHRPDATPDVRSVGQGLAIAFNGPTSAAMAEPTPGREPVATAEIGAPSPSPEDRAVARLRRPPRLPPPSRARPPAARGEVAHSSRGPSARPGTGTSRSRCWATAGSRRRTSCCRTRPASSSTCRA